MGFFRKLFAPKAGGTVIGNILRSVGLNKRPVPTQTEVDAYWGRSTPSTGIVDPNVAQSLQKAAQDAGATADADKKKTSWKKWLTIGGIAAGGTLITVLLMKGGKRRKY